MTCNHHFSRRDVMLASMGLMGYGTMGRLLPILASPSAEPHPLAPRAPHFAPWARRAIMFFMTGGVSHVDSFDPKPELIKQHGKTYGPERKGNAQTLRQSLWTAKQWGQSGIWATDLFPHTSAMLDDICLIRSIHGNHGDHFEATLHMHTGSDGSARPGIGAWVSYGLGTQNVNLPSHVVFAEKKPYAGAQVWDSNFLPAYHQGVRLIPGAEPIPNLRPDPAVSPSLQQMELKMLERVNQRHLSRNPNFDEYAARILSFRTAQSMQQLAPDLFDLAAESDSTLGAYGVQRGDNTSFGWQCLMARRMAERGVRFIELVDVGSSGNWDNHSGMERHGTLAANIDQPIAGLLSDLKQRGMLEDTLVIWCTEFGRTPWSDNDGRGHHRSVFTCWLAGGGVKGGHVHGASDEIGGEVASDGVHVHDFHATILHLMGLDHEKLTYHHSGRDFRLTDVYGNVVNEILA